MALMAKFVQFIENTPHGDREFFVDLDSVCYLEIGKKAGSNEDFIKVITINGGEHGSTFDASSPTGKKILAWLEKNRL